MRFDQTVIVRQTLFALVALALMTSCLMPCGAERDSVGSIKHLNKRMLLAHYMPWYTSKPYSGQWGWHWTMNHFNPDHVVNGRPDAASHYRPLIGLYDSSDPDTLQCQVLLMKIAGIDGVIVDWYGNDEYMDYGVNNRNTEKLIPFLQAAGLKFAICYETHTVVTEIAGNQFPASDVVGHGQRLMQWMQSNFFSLPSYVHIDGKPLLLSFGDPYYTDSQWNEIFSVLPKHPAYITEENRIEPTASLGGFGWPLPAGGTAKGLSEVGSFYDRAKPWQLFIGDAFPRFNDIYAEAGVGKSWGHIDDRNGNTFTDTLEKGLKGGAPIIQLVTWNDYGEGTQIEPTTEYGYRDLQAVQKVSHTSYTAQDLRIPVEWYQLRKRYAKNTSVSAALAKVPSLVITGKVERARKVMAKYDR
jgi:hypothetical protein